MRSHSFFIADFSPQEDGYFASSVPSIQQYQRYRHLLVDKTLMRERSDPGSERHG